MPDVIEISSTEKSGSNVSLEVLDSILIDSLRCSAPARTPLLEPLDVAPLQTILHLMEEYMSNPDGHQRVAARTENLRREHVEHLESNASASDSPQGSDDSGDEVIEGNAGRASLWELADGVKVDKLANR